MIARDDDFADAMSATGLAGTLEAPIVLTNRNGLSDAAADAVKALGAEKAYIIGGKGAIPGNLESELEAIGCQVIDRIFGNESWDTSAACAKMITEHGGNPNGDAIVAMSSNFQDALSISSFAYKYKVPIFLETNGNERELPSADAKPSKIRRELFMCPVARARRQEALSKTYSAKIALHASSAKTATTHQIKSQPIWLTTSCFRRIRYASPPEPSAQGRWRTRRRSTRRQSRRRDVAGKRQPRLWRGRLHCRRRIGLSRHSCVSDFACPRCRPGILARRQRRNRSRSSAKGDGTARMTSVAADARHISFATAPIRSSGAINDLLQRRERLQASRP